MTQAEQRAAVVKEALEWQGTPFADCVGIKGVGTDCAWFPFRVYRALSLIPEIEVPEYRASFMLHSSEQRYLAVVEKVAVETQAPKPGDLAMWWFGRCYSHGAIVIDWPRIIHAVKPVGVLQDDALTVTRLTELDRGSAHALRRKVGDPRPRKFYTLKVWA